MEISKCGFDTVLYILLKVSVSVFLCGKVKFTVIKDILIWGNSIM